MDNVLYMANGSGHFSTVDNFLHSSLMKDLYGNSIPTNKTAEFIPASKIHCNGIGGCS
jgi:hypothetical protein